jgi:nucleotide-binding universal stress UspA family protein
MPYKTILVHLNNEPRVARLISAAVQLARPGDAHLTGLFVVPSVKVRSPIFPALSGGIVQSGLDDYRRAGERIHQAFDVAVRGLPLVAEWRLHEPRRDSYAEAVLDSARAVDLVVVAQKESDWDYADMFDIPDVIALESGRPTLVVPTGGNLDSIGSRVLVAWNNSRESARAVFDALPVLQQAKDVRVLCVREAAKPVQTGDLAGTEIGAALARHGIKCTVDHVERSRGEPGEMLLAEARSDGCDLIVMGCYGRSRFREFVLGGASRYVMHNTTVPVLMSH